MDVEWIYTRVSEYLELRDASVLRGVTKSARVAVDLTEHCHRYNASLIVSRTVLRWHAIHTMLHAFIARCTEDILYRRRHVHVHMEPRAHLCVRYMPWFHNNDFKIVALNAWKRQNRRLADMLLVAQNNPVLIQHIIDYWPDITLL